jgi:hypothetical protein
VSGAPGHPGSSESGSPGSGRDDAGGSEPGSDAAPPAALRRLDPDLASGRSEPVGAPGAEPERDRAPRPATVDTRRYRWMLGIFGLALVIVASIYQFATNGVASTGVAPGHRLHWFAAPLATSTLIGDPNVSPPCTLAQHDPRALNICLIASERPLVLSLFVIGSSDCEHQVDVLQTLSRHYPAVQFAAVAINGSRADTAALVRSHHWTIPVAYDRDGAVGGLYGVAVCPMAELAARGGIVRDRLIGDQYQTVAEITPRVAALARASAR